MQESYVYVVQAKSVEDGRVNIGNVSAAINAAQADFVGGADDLSRLDAAARHPHREAPWIVIAPVALFVERCAAEFPALDDERVFQQAARFQIRQ